MSFRTGLWMRDGGSALSCVIDGYEAEYSFTIVDGWKECEFNPDYGFSDSWDKVSVEQVLKKLRRADFWEKKYETMLLDFPEGFVDVVGEREFNTKLETTESVMKALREMADISGRILPEDAEILDFENKSERVGKAYRFARDKHQGQKDKAGADYILHPMKVASAAAELGESSIILALLHDVVEDTEVTLEDLTKQGFVNDEERDALGYLTHDDDKDYAAYIEQIGHNRLAKGVKIADLMHNADLRRIAKPSEKDCKRARKYIISMWKLMFGDGLSLEEFRDMLNPKQV